MKRTEYLGLFLAVIALFSLLFGGRETISGSAAGEARGECVVEISSRRILHEKDAHARLPMASTTKVLTAILILDDCRIDETVKIPKAAEGVEGSSVYLRAGEEYTVRELLYGLMLRSGNDCAVTLALHHSGSIEAFSEKMNEKAALLGELCRQSARPSRQPPSYDRPRPRPDLRLCDGERNLPRDRFLQIL